MLSLQVRVRIEQISHLFRTSLPLQLAYSPVDFSDFAVERIEAPEWLRP